MYRQSGFALVVLVFSVIFVITLGAILVFFSHRQSQNVTRSYPSNSDISHAPVISTEVEDKLRYSSMRCGFSFEAPKYVRIVPPSENATECDQEVVWVSYRTESRPPEEADLGVKILPGGISLQFSTEVQREGETLWSQLVAQSQQDGPGHIDLDYLRPVTINGVHGFLVASNSAYNQYAFVLHGEKVRLRIGFGGSDSSLTDKIVSTLRETRMTD